MFGAVFGYASRIGNSVFMYLALALLRLIIVCSAFRTDSRPTPLLMETGIWEVV